jgi:hypothetical protein
MDIVTRLDEIAARRSEERAYLAEIAAGNHRRARAEVLERKIVALARMLNNDPPSIVKAGIIWATSVSDETSIEYLALEIGKGLTVAVELEPVIGSSAEERCYLITQCTAGCGRLMAALVHNVASIDAWADARLVTHHEPPEPCGEPF